MPRQSRFDLANLALDGKLPAWLREWREAGYSYEDIAFELRAYGIEVSGVTVREWVLEHLTEPV